MAASAEGAGQELHGGAKVINFGVIATFAAFAAFPFLWMLITMFKQTNDLLDPNHNPFLYHMPPTLENLRVLFEDTYFVQWIGNTMLVGILVVLITLGLAVPAGYSLARLAGGAGEKLAIAIFLTYLVPPTILFIPLSRIVSFLGLQDSLWALVLVYPSFTVPFCTWLLMGFFKSLPREIEEAAWVDGCGLLGGIVRVILPLSRPGIMIATIFPITFAMNEVLYAVVFVGPREQRTVTLAIASTLIRGDIFYWGSLMAAGLLVGLPLAILYIFYLDYFIRGLTGAEGAH